MSGPKPDCYKCKYRAELPGSAHSQCTHPKAQPAKDDALGSVLAILGGARGFPGLTEKSLDAAISLGIKLNLHGRTGSLEVYKPVGEDRLAMRGRGPAGYQDMVRRTLASFVDPEKRLALPPVEPGVGW